MEFIKLKNFQGIHYNRRNSAVKVTQFKTELFAIENIHPEIEQESHSISG